MYDLSKLIGRSKKTDINLVVAINQVDNLGKWNDKINCPTPEAEKEIEARAKDIIKKLSSGEFAIDKDQIEYYSALRAYRLHQLNGKITKYCKDGVLMINKPVEFYVQIENDTIREAAAAAMAKEDAKIEEKYGIKGFIAKLAPYLEKKDLEQLEKLWNDVQAKPVRVAVLGKCGVGKSTTVNNLFRGILKETETKTLRTSRIGVGNAEAQYKYYELPQGGKLTIVDLPGYGRSIAEDETYQQIYINEIKDCDIILLIVQANSSDFVDDQIMIQSLIEWKKAKLI